MIDQEYVNCNTSKHCYRVNVPFFTLQVAVMSVTIAPIRLLLVILLLLLVWPFAALCTAFRTEADKEKPVTGWRK